MSPDWPADPDPISLARLPGPLRKVRPLKVDCSGLRGSFATDVAAAFFLTACCTFGACFLFGLRLLLLAVSFVFCEAFFATAFFLLTAFFFAPVRFFCAMAKLYHARERRGVYVTPSISRSWCAHSFVDDSGPRITDAF